MKRRIILIIIIVGVLGGLGAGVFWYVRRNFGLKLLARAELAMRAEKFDKALSLAERYVAKYPDQWRGRYVKAQALIHLGRYADARSALAEAAKLEPSEVLIPIALAESYTLPARRALARRETMDQPRVLTTTIKQFKQANEILLKANTSGPKRALDVRQEIGLNYHRIAFAWRAVGERLAREAKTAEVSRDADSAAAKRKESDAAFAESNEATDQAINTLLEVVRKDASREIAARVLAELCIQRGDEKLLAAARKAIMAPKSPPPVAATILAVHDQAREPDSAKRRKRLGELCQFLDGLLKKHPEEVEVKLARANAAAMVGDSATADRLCREILKANRRQGRASLIQARLMMQQGKAAEAELILWQLKRDRPRWPAAHFNYAQAALAAGKKERATEALRTVTKLDPDHALAHRYLAESLLQDGFYDQAFADAQEFYRISPDDPAALRLYVETAVRTGQPQLAEQQLEKAGQKYKDSPAMLLSMATGYNLLGQNGKAREALANAASCKPTSTEGRLAVAEALRLSKRAPEAEKTLMEEIAKDPNQPRVRFELGELFFSMGRLLQAMEEFRAAARMDARNVHYHLALARALFNIRDLDQCQNVLNQIDPANTDANLLRLRVRLDRGQTVPVEEMLRQVRGQKRTGLPLAMIYLVRGRPQECVEVCLDGLERTPQDSGLRFLLGRAYRALGQKDKCIEQWTMALQAEPGRFPWYQSLAAELVLDRGPQEVRKALAAIAGARPEIIDLTMGWLHTVRGDLKAAADAYGRLSGRAGVSDYYRNRAGLLRARALAAEGDTDAAVGNLDKMSESQARLEKVMRAQLDKEDKAGRGNKAKAIALQAALSSITSWQMMITEAKVDILIRSGRHEEAKSSLVKLRKLAGQKKDAFILRRIATLYARTNRTEEAMAVCDQVRSLFPNDARSYRLRAGLLSEAGRRREAIPLLQKAIDLQPGSFRTYMALAMTLDAEQQPRKALDVLKRMENLGRAGQIESLFQQGVLFGRWGLYAQSLECFQRLAAEGQTSIPGLQLGLGRAFAALGKKDRARDLLKGISVYSPQYVAGRQLLATMAKTDREKLQIIEQLEKTKPGHADVLMQKMAVLLGAGRPAEAAKAFTSFVAQREKRQPMPASASYLAVRAMLAANDRGAAAEIAARTAKQTGLPLWRHLAVLLNLDDQPATAAKMLPTTDKADLYAALLGLVMAAQKPDSAAAQKWADYINMLSRQPAETPGAGVIPPRYRLLAALAAGRVSQASDELKKLRALNSGAAKEFLSWARGKAKASVEAAKLLKASVAIDLGLADLGRSWATEVLKGRPECQLAAAVVLQSKPDVPALKDLLETIRPPDCVQSRLVQASLLMSEKHYSKAAEVYRQAADADKENPYLVLSQAIATERAGRLEEALLLYRKVWQVTTNPVAANNAAYLVCQLYPKDTDRLGEALQWMDAAVKAAPRAYAFRDTKGWITFLLGRKDQAAIEARRAIEGLPNSPEVHYHLGLIETDAGNRDLGRWHLAAAVSSAEAIKADGREPTVAEVKAAKAAADALAKMERNQN